MTVEEALEEKFHNTASDIIDMIYICDTVAMLQEFHDETDLHLKSDDKHEMYTKFEKTVIYEHFYNRLNFFLDKDEYNDTISPK